MALGAGKALKKRDEKLEMPCERPVCGTVQAASDPVKAGGVFFVGT